MMVKNKRRERRVIVEEVHVCGGRCTGEGGLEADEVGGLSSRGGVDVGSDEEVVLEDGEHGDLEVKRW
jgi:hypothetical protein